MLIKPKKLKRGDRIATVSPSCGGAGEPELRWCYEQGITERFAARGIGASEGNNPPESLAQGWIIFLVERQYAHDYCCKCYCKHQSFEYWHQHQKEIIAFLGLLKEYILNLVAK